MTTKREQTYQRILDAATQSFKCNGFSGVGVNTIAQAADVTTGAFYAHFGSKDGAFEAVIHSALKDSLRLIAGFQRRNGKKWLKAYVDFYLSRQHRVDMAGGCAIPALAPEIARAAPEHQMAYDGGMASIVDVICAGLAKGSFDERRGRAQACLSALTGGLILARAARAPKLAKSIAQTCRVTALEVAGKTCKVTGPDHSFAESPGID